MRKGLVLWTLVIVMLAAAVAEAQMGYPRTPFIRQFSRTFDGYGAVAVLNVPADKHLVIETCSVVVSVPRGQQVVSASVEATFGVDPTCADGGCPYQANFYLPVALQGSDPTADSDTFTGTQAMRLYAEAGSKVIGYAFKNLREGSISFTFAVSGYLISKTSPNLSP